MIFLRDDIAQLWSPCDAMDKAFALHGEVFRDVPGRRTLRVQLADKFYFVKLHYGAGWAEVVKNWLQFKWPVVGAENEFKACQGLAEAGLVAPVPAAYSSAPGNIAIRRSFVLCDELQGYTSLEDVTDPWINGGLEERPTSVRRQRLLYAVALFAKQFHELGFIHRDFYICHLLASDKALISEQFALAVLDLHRARRFVRVPERWLKRDLAALLFSSLDLGYSRRDWLRFIRIYTGKPLRQVWAEQGPFWQAVLVRAEKLYREGLRKGTVQGLYRS